MIRRRAFSLIEVLVALAVMVTLAAVIVPGVVQILDRARVDRGYESLNAISAAVLAFRTDVGHSPAALTQLSEPITGAMSSSCGVSYGQKGGQAAKAWAGPYLNRIVPTTGLPVGIGTAENALNQVGATLQVTVNGVLEADALALDTRVDGGDGAGAGGVQWSGTDFVTLLWVMPAPAC